MASGSILAESSAGVLCAPAPPLFWGAHAVRFQGNTAGPGGFGRHKAENEGQCLGSGREGDRGKGTSLPPSSSPLERGRWCLAGATAWGEERRWEATSGPPPAQRCSLRPREGRTLAHEHTVCRRQERGPHGKASLSTRGCDAWWTPCSEPCFQQGSEVWIGLPSAKLLWVLAISGTSARPQMG